MKRLSFNKIVNIEHHLTSQNGFPIFDFMQDIVRDNGRGNKIEYWGASGTGFYTEDEALITQLKTVLREKELDEQVAFVKNHPKCIVDVDAIPRMSDKAASAYANLFDTNVFLLCYSQKVADKLGEDLLRKYPNESAYTTTLTAPALVITEPRDKSKVPSNQIGWMPNELTETHQYKNIITTLFPKSQLIYHDEKTSIISGFNVLDNRLVSLFNSWLKEKKCTYEFCTYSYAPIEKMKPTVFSQNLIAQKLHAVARQKTEGENSKKRIGKI